jgi:transcriptional regulator with XRE-family HTH domain
MAALSLQPDERARKNLALILQALATAGQAELAKILEVSESTLSRMKDGDIPQMAKLLAHCGLKVVPNEYRCEDPAYLAAIELLASKYMAGVSDPAPKLKQDWDARP